MKYDKRMYTIFENDEAIDNYIQAWANVGHKVTMDWFTFPIDKVCPICKDRTVKVFPSGFCYGSFIPKKVEGSSMDGECVYETVSRSQYYCKEGHNFYEQSGRLYKESELQDWQRAKV